MSNAELTRQQLDPAATFGAYRSTVILAMIAIVGAITMTALEGDPAGRPALLIASLSVLAIASLWLVRAADPLRAPFRRHSMIIIYALVVVAVGLSTSATFGFNPDIADDWGPIAIAIFTIAIAPYRPAREMFIALAVLTVPPIALSLTTVPDLAGGLPALAMVVVALTPTVAVSVAAIQYSRYLVAGVQSWHRRADVGAASLASAMTDVVVSAVERDRVSILSRDVSPLFSELLARGTIDDGDRERARSIAESMRSAMVADANRTWLSAAFASTSRGADFISVDDPSFLAGHMIARQRTALRAILVAMVDDDRLDRVDVSIRPHGARGILALRMVPIAHVPPGIAADYDTYFSVLRVVFAAFRVDVDNQTVNVRLEYDCS